MAHPDYDTQISYPEPELMTALRDEYTQDGTLDLLSDTANDLGHEMFDEPCGPDHSWIAFAVETYAADPGHLHTVFETFMDNHVPFNEEYRDASGRNEMAIIADNFGFAGLARALNIGLDAASADEADDHGVTARSVVAETAGPKGTQLLEAYEANQRHHGRASWFGAAFGGAAGILTAVLTRQPEAGAIVAMVGAGAAKLGGNEVADNILDAEITRIRTAGDPGLKAA